jgi:hypothetical protein
MFCCRRRWARAPAGRTPACRGRGPAARGAPCVNVPRLDRVREWVLQVSEHQEPYRPHPSAPRVPPCRGNARAGRRRRAARAVTGGLLAGLRAARVCVSTGGGEVKSRRTSAPSPGSQTEAPPMRAPARASPGTATTEEEGERDPVYLGCGRRKSRWAVGPTALAGPFEPTGLLG